MGIRSLVEHVDIVTDKNNIAIQKIYGDGAPLSNAYFAFKEAAAAAIDENGERGRGDAG